MAHRITLPPHVIACDPKTIASYRQLSEFAPRPAKILIWGETGTGKEFASEFVHQLSGRKGKLVTVNLAAINPGTFAGELFGHKRGSYTDAHADAPGYIAEANGGTIFLDEIGATPKQHQPTLLRFLESGEVQPLGGRPQRVDVRVITGTNADVADPEQMRPDMLERIAELWVHLLPLRERGEQTILRMAEHFARTFAADPKWRDPAKTPLDTARPFADDALALLCARRWRGNARELRRVVLRAVILADGPQILADDLPHDPWTAPNLHHGADAQTTAVVQPRKNVDVDVFVPWAPYLRTMQADYFARVLIACGGHRERASAVLGVNESTLWRVLSGSRR